jgi:hypothetical protein
MGTSAIVTLIGGIGALLGLIYAVVKLSLKYIDLNVQLAEKEKKIRKARYTSESVQAVAKISLVIAGQHEVTDEHLRLAKQIYYGAIDQRLSRQTINNFDDVVKGMISMKSDVLKDDIRRNTLLPISGITSYE